MLEAFHNSCLSIFLLKIVTNIYFCFYFKDFYRPLIRSLVCNKFLLQVPQTGINNVRWHCTITWHGGVLQSWIFFSPSASDEKIHSRKYVKSILIVKRMRPRKNLKISGIQIFLSTSLKTLSWHTSFRMCL